MQRKRCPFDIRVSHCSVWSRPGRNFFYKERGEEGWVSGEGNSERSPRSRSG